MDERLELLGAPDLEAAGFRLWVHGREFPESHPDSHDHDWLLITACCEAPSATIILEGPYLRVDDLARLEQGCRELSAGNHERFELSPMENNLEIIISHEADKKHFQFDVILTPDIDAKCKLALALYSHSHQFEYRVGDAIMHELSRACGCIIERYRKG
jgi:hypothetical protein